MVLKERCNVYPMRTMSACERQFVRWHRIRGPLAVLL
jgi:hypothetical protein